MKHIMINGVPRSGTSWLGQIFNSCSNVAYRYQPLFSYPLKGALTIDSTELEILKFFEDSFNIDDEMVLQKKQRIRNVHPIFTKSVAQNYLVVKHVRYHYLIEHILKTYKKIKIIGIVRHPCGVINSWLKTPREFSSDWNMSEWRRGELKNKNKPEEYFGFEKWKEVAKLFLNLKNKYPNKIKLIRYEDLVSNRLNITNELFDFCNLDIEDQTINFLNDSKLESFDDPDTVYRHDNVAVRWKSELDKSIIDEIYNDLLDTGLEVFLRD